MVGASPFHRKVIDSQNKRALVRLYAGNWTALLEVQGIPFMLFIKGNGSLVAMWNSPPTADPKPREIETTKGESDEGSSHSCCMV